MTTQPIIIHRHATLPLVVVVEKDTISGRYPVITKINNVDITIETPGNESLAKYRAEFLYNLWAERLIPVFDAGFKAGQGA